MAISNVSCANTKIGNVATIYIDKAKSNYKHTLTYVFENLSGTIVKKTTASKYEWTIPKEFYTQMPTSTSKICTITCETFNGSTPKGATNCTFYVKIKESACKPEVTIEVIDINPDTVAVTGNNGILVKYCSTA